MIFVLAALPFAALLLVAIGGYVLFAPRGENKTRSMSLNHASVLDADNRR